ncbi:MAG: cyclic nucleotide-binding domain-containing protein [Actinobacteria bacterium]|nr:cyclic nucleotide-binding domain-containing protein [Actinomycetota bacterium]
MVLCSTRAPTGCLSAQRTSHDQHVRVACGKPPPSGYASDGKRRSAAQLPSTYRRWPNATNPQDVYGLSVDSDVRSAISMSHLGGLAPDVLEELLADAERIEIPAGSVTHREGENAPHLELVISGVVRVFITAPDGRTMTIRYCRPGALIGALSLFGAAFTMPATTQALVNAHLLKMSPAVVRRAAERDVRVARTFLGELSERVQNFIYEIAGSAFTTVRQRVARHLLDLASEAATERFGQTMVVSVSQQELADAAGKVREVVVRVLRGLRQIGAIQTERDRIVIIDASRLIDEQGWNSSS